MSKTFSSILKYKWLIFTLLLAGILRFYNLGYSDYQGDEIKALFLPEKDQNVIEYLLDQRKGPIQFGITYLLKFADPEYRNQLLIRLPFAVAGFLSVFYFYKIVKEEFNEKIAFYSTFFFVTNGFLIAFSRIVQYQSFVIMFMIGALYYLKKKNVYLGLIFWALSILSHYDGIFIFPLAFYYLYIYVTDTNKIIEKDLLNIGKLVINKKHLLHLVLSGIIATALLASFYIPFVLNITKATQDYWMGRVTGNVSDKKSSSIYLFSVYQPIYVIKIYLGLFTLGFIAIFGLCISRLKFFINKLGKIQAFFSTVIPIKNIGELRAIILWTLIAFLFMEAIVYIPGTHIYTYIIPTAIIIGLGISFIEKVFSKVTWIFYIGVAAIFTFIFLQSYFIYVDNYREYPWEDEKFLIWTLSKPSATYHLSMFGFPYFRDWEGVQDFIKEYPSKQQGYTTNERVTISRYYVDLIKGADTAGFFVHILNPQSFEQIVPYEKPAHYVNNYTPIFTFNKNGRDLVNIYLMEVGTKEEVLKRTTQR